jgi:predicted RNA binding protein YcfA (HicA-like mRNA interferase family)
VLQDAVNGAGSIEPGRDGKPTGDGGGLEPTGFLHPPDVQLQVGSLDGQRVQSVLGAPGTEQDGWTETRWSGSHSVLVKGDQQRIWASHDGVDLGGPAIAADRP